MPEPIVLDGASLTLAEIVSIADRAGGVSLSGAGRSRALRSARFAEEQAGERLLYGRSTGVGANRSTVVAGSPENSLALLRSHATGAGPLRESNRVRATMLIRANQLAAGGSGVRPEVLDHLVEMIAVDALPEMHVQGSIGTGDLPALSAVGLALCGERPTAPGRVQPVALSSADGLALISSNAATLADAALAAVSLIVGARAAVLVSALTATAVRANREAFGPAIERVSPFPGVQRVAGWLRRLLPADLPAARIQDPFALRAWPQVHGPVFDALDALAGVVELMVNAPAENPVLIPDLGPAGVAHHGGFFATSLQLALDQAKLAVAQSGPAVLARLGLLTDPVYSGLPPFLGSGVAGASGVMVCEYVAASALGDIRATAQPAGLQTAVISCGVEEDASFASLAARQALDLAGKYRILLATELVAAVRALRRRPVDGLSAPLAQALTACRALPEDDRDRDLSPDLALAVDLLPGLADLLPESGQPMSSSGRSSSA